MKTQDTFTTTFGNRADITGLFIVRERPATIDEMTLAEYADYHKRTYGDDSADNPYVKYATAAYLAGFEDGTPSDGRNL